MIHIWRLVWWNGRWDVFGRRHCSRRPISIFLLKKIGLLLTRNFLLTLMLDSEATLWWYQWFDNTICGLDRTIERVVNLNVAWLGLVFVLILFVHMHGGVVVPYSDGEGGTSFKVGRPRPVGVRKRCSS